MLRTLSTKELVRLLADDIRVEGTMERATCKICGERLCANSMKLHYNTHIKQELFKQFFGLETEIPHADFVKKHCKVGYSAKFIDFIKN
jgi:hypothetical protein